MSTNPNKAIGTNAAYGGRTSVKAFNDALGVYDGRGVVSGWGVSPKLGMVVKVGGNGTVRDIAIAENNTGDYTTINNISEEPVSITIPTAPTSNARYDSIVAYVDNPPSGSATVADNPAAVGIIVVSGTVAGSPTFADESTIRDAITVDGGTGATAYYVVLADIYVASGTTDITTNLITVRNYATTSKITPSSVTSSMLAQEGLGVPMYASNLAIANDTPRVWAETLGGTGHYWIWYEESGLFANQPTQWGVLEVFVWVDGAGRYDVSQTWYNHPNGTRMYHRTGNSSGWNGSSSGSGAFTQLAMLPVTSDNIDWTTIENIDITSRFIISATITRAFITRFGKIGFINLAFTPSSNLNGTIVELPAGLGIKPLYSTELTARINLDLRRATFTPSNNGGSVISVDMHTSSANSFCSVFGMVFLA